MNRLDCPKDDKAITERVAYYYHNQQQKIIQTHAPKNNHPKEEEFYDEINSF